MSLSLEDSLTDLLSDKSNDNDDFFEGTLPAPKSNTKNVAASSSSAKSKLSKASDNLFGITEESLEQNMSRSRPAATSTPRKSNDDDIFGTDDEDLGFDPKKPKATGSAKLALFDDIIAGTFTDSKRAAVPTPATRRSANRPAAISRQSTDTTTENSNVPRPKTATGRRGSVLSSGGGVGIAAADTHSLFSQPTNKELAAPKFKKLGTTADWLGLNATEAEDELATPRPLEKRATSPKTMQDSRPQILTLTEPTEPQDAHESTIVPEDSPDTAALAAVAAPTVQSIFQLKAINQETRNAYALLQQQEPQLTLAAQMKQQERALYEMQRRQEALIQQQERQFQMLLQQQLQRQQHLEENVKQQQQRINAHIQLMMMQPVAALDALPTKQVDAAMHDAEEAQPQAATAAVLTTPSELHTTQAALEIIQIETDIRRLELEKQRLEELVANMGAKYEREIEMIEATHKKQLQVADEHTAALEARLRAEISEINEHYKRKLEALESEYQQSKQNWEAEVAALRHDHEEELRRIRKMHEDDLDMLREEQRRTLEAVQRSKLLEFAVVQDNNSYLDTLKAAAANLTEANGELKDLREHLHAKLESVNMEKQQELELCERRLVERERRLQLSEAATAQEKSQLMTLVTTLEQQLSTLTKESSEENWQLRLKLSALEADKVAFEREREYAREQLQRDEQRLAELKERQVAELQRMNLELQEERRQLQTEKIKYETEQKLRTANSSLERERCELETAMKCAQDATRQADAQRQRYNKLQREVEQRQRELDNQEHELRVKQEKLQSELKACCTAEQQARNAAQRARLVEQNYQEKLQALQARTRELASKEAFLAEERKLLTQQRIAIKEMQTRRKEENREMLKSAPAKRVETTNTSLNLIDRVLDDNIAECLQRMHIQTPPNTGVKSIGRNAWPAVGLDDDSKSLVLNSNLDALELGLHGRVVTEL